MHLNEYLLKTDTLQASKQTGIQPINSLLLLKQHNPQAAPNTSLWYHFWASVLPGLYLEETDALFLRGPDSQVMGPVAFL